MRRCSWSDIRPVIGSCAPYRTKATAHFERSWMRPITNCGLPDMTEGGGRDSRGHCEMQDMQDLMAFWISNGVMDQ